MTDEGDHGGAPVIDGPLRTAAPTKSIVTLRRGGCPHPPIRWPPHLTIPTLIRPRWGHLPPEWGRLWGRGNGIPQSAALTAPFNKGANPLSHRLWRCQLPHRGSQGTGGRRAAGDSGPYVPGMMLSSEKGTRAGIIPAAPWETYSAALHRPFARVTRTILPAECERTWTTV